MRVFSLLVIQESNPPLTESLSGLLALVEQATDVLIGTHLNPDGDAIGSALAVSHWLTAMGVSNEIVCNNLPPGYLQYLPGQETIRTIPNRQAHDLGIIVDLDSTERLGSCQKFFDSIEKLVVVDHHEPHEKPGNLRIVDPKSPATASILTDLFALPENPEPITQEMATCLLTGLVTDTGGFRYVNTTSDSLHKAAFLVERGASLFQVMDEVYLNRDEPSVHLLGRALNNMKMAHNKKLAWVILRPEWFEEFGAGEEHTEGIVNEILSARSVVAAFVLRAGKNGKVKGSLRSKGTLDVAKIAQKIGGGGHKNAAGVTIENTLEGAEAIVLEALGSVIEQGEFKDQGK